MSQRVVLMSGPPAVGKTLTARGVARRLGAALLDLDTVTNPLVDVIAESMGVKDYSDKGLSKLVREARYQALYDTAKDCLECGLDIVMVAPFTLERQSPERLALVSERFAQFGPTYLIWLKAAPELILARMRQRGASRDIEKLSDEGDFLRSLRDQIRDPASDHLCVDAAEDLKVRVERIVEALEH